MQQLQNNLKIGITGLGLIGGSIYKCLVQNNFKNIFAHTQNQKTISTITNDGFCADNDINILKNCDLIFICSPISETTNMLKRIFAINPNAIFIDVASLKYDILKEIEEIENCKFIGSHPMAGTENSGFDASFAELFENAKWVITPSKNTRTEDLNILEKIISITKATTITMDAKEHDKAVALISHTPMLLSQALMKSAIGQNNMLKLAASGFRDTTRLALSNKIMANDMLTLNKENIKLALETITKEAQSLLNSDYFNSNIDNIIEQRKNLYDKNGKNIF